MIKKIKDMISALSLIAVFGFIILFHICRLFGAASSCRSVLPKEDLLLIEQAQGEGLVEPELGYYN